MSAAAGPARPRFDGAARTAARTAPEPAAAGRSDAAGAGDQAADIRWMIGSISAPGAAAGTGKIVAV